MEETKTVTELQNYKDFGPVNPSFSYSSNSIFEKLNFGFGSHEFYFPPNKIVCSLLLISCFCSVFANLSIVP